MILSLLALLPAGRALGQAAPEDPATAVRLAKAAFEYRDFERVVAILDPWLHPPRIVDPKLEVKARELMGVSQHVLGRTSAAQEEFAQLLKLAPKHELDPFVVPPPVVQTFEEVRAKMKPLLDKIGTPPPTGDPDPPPVQVKTRVEVRAVPHAAVLITPLGIPQFVLDEPAWGVMWGAIQVVGLGLNILGAVLADGVSINPADNARYNQYLGVMYGGLAVFAGGWIGSGVHGLSQLEDRRAAILRAPTAPPPGPSAQLGWSWRF